MHPRLAGAGTLPWVVPPPSRLPPLPLNPCIGREEDELEKPKLRAKNLSTPSAYHLEQSQALGYLEQGVQASIYLLIEKQRSVSLTRYRLPNLI